MTEKIKVALIFGGTCPEREVSIISATEVYKVIDLARYEVFPILVTSEGQWQLVAFNKDTGFSEAGILLSLLPAYGQLTLVSEKTGMRYQPDVVFPLIHGILGEDGSLQGLLEFFGIPFVGAGVLGSAIGMDKGVTKQLAELAGVPIVPYLVFETHESEDEHAVRVRCEAAFSYPWFIKPLNTGSSIGVSKVNAAADFSQALELARSYDSSVIIEKGLLKPREIEMAVLGQGNELSMSEAFGEIRPKGEFYDYDTKYLHTDHAELIVPAILSSDLQTKLRHYAVIVYQKLRCAGMARIDFLVDPITEAIYFSELNTIPGFTPTSMYPQIWEAGGLSYATLVDKLIALALKRRELQRNRRLDRHDQKKTSECPA